MKRNARSTQVQIAIQIMRTQLLVVILIGFSGNMHAQKDHEELKKALKEQQKENKVLKDSIAHMRVKVDSTMKVVKVRNASIDSLKARLTRKESMVDSVKSALEDKKNAIKALSETASSCSDALGKKEKTITELTDKNDRLLSSQKEFIDVIGKILQDEVTFQIKSAEFDLARTGKLIDYCNEAKKYDENPKYDKWITDLVTYDAKCRLVQNGKTLLNQAFDYQRQASWLSAYKNIGAAAQSDKNLGAWKAVIEDYCQVSNDSYNKIEQAEANRLQRSQVAKSILEAAQKKTDSRYIFLVEEMGRLEKAVYGESTLTGISRIKKADCN